MKVTIVTLRALDGDRENNMVGVIQGSLTEEQRAKVADKVMLQNSGDDMEVAFAEVTAYEEVSRFRTLVPDDKTDLIMSDEDDDDEDEDFDDEDEDEDEDEDIEEDEDDEIFDEDDEDEDDED